MSRKPRNYRAEYQRRIERGKQKGYSKAVARGHPKRGYAGIRAADFLGIKPGESMGLLERNSRGRVRIVVRDAHKQFGSKPKRVKGDTPAIYEEKLVELQRQGGKFEWTDEAAFIEAMSNLGLTERDAYTHWFSP